MNKNKLGQTFSKLFQEIHNQHQSSKEQYEGISERMTKMKSEMDERRKKFKLIRNR
ncbi:MAG TPA: hypothetical protein VK085_08985 [Pseudogracilibacillus sp.]|nr:hypothetical protein [Pseudogracilibacillus sp.]